MDLDFVRVLAAADLIERVVIVVEPTHLLCKDFLVRTHETNGVGHHAPFFVALREEDNTSGR